MDTKDLDLTGQELAAAFIVDAAPLAGIATGQRFSLTAEPLSPAARKVLDGAHAPFDERRPSYALYHRNQLVGFTTALEAPVRELLNLGFHVVLDAERTSAPLAGYEGVELHMPGAEPLENWCELARYGVTVPVGAQVVVANLNIDDEHPQLPNGPVTVRVGHEDDERIPVTLETPDGASDSYKLYPRQHSFRVFQQLEGRTLASAVVVHKDSWTERGTRYMKVFMAV